MDEEPNRQAGRLLAEAWLEATTIDMPSDLLPEDRDEAYATQDQMAQRLAIEPDHTVVGWKVGATSLGVQRAEGYDGPIPGRIFASSVYGNGAIVPQARCLHAKVEAEIAFWFVSAPFQQDYPFQPGRLAEMVKVLPAFDITSTRYNPSCRDGWDSRQNMLAGIADNGNGGVVLLGAETSFRRDMDLMKLGVDLRVDDGESAPNLWDDSRGDPLAALAWTVNHVYERGFVIAAGDVVLTGSLTEPLSLEPGDLVKCSMPGLGNLSCQVSRA
jgi:2-keto-4-pentenoate hydratase